MAAKKTTPRPRAATPRAKPSTRIGSGPSWEHQRYSKSAPSPSPARRWAQSAPVLLGIIMQSFLAIWWASVVSKDIAHLKSQMDANSARIATINDTRFTSNDEQQYRIEVDARISRMEERVRQIELSVAKQRQPVK